MCTFWREKKTITQALWIQTITLPALQTLVHINPPCYKHFVAGLVAVARDSISQLLLPQKSGRQDRDSNCGPKTGRWVKVPQVALLPPPPLPAVSCTYKHGKSLPRRDKNACCGRTKGAGNSLRTRIAQHHLYHKKNWLHSCHHLQHFTKILHL